MLDRIEKDAKDLDWSKVDFMSGNWKWSRGGRPLEDNEHAISYIDEDLTETRYKLPPCINEMLKSVAEHAVVDVQRRIKRVLRL